MAITAIPSFKSGTSVIPRTLDPLPVANSGISCRKEGSLKLALPPGVQYVIPELELENLFTSGR
jgi:hypothetical protein